MNVKGNDTTFNDSLRPALDGVVDVVGLDKKTKTKYKAALALYAKLERNVYRGKKAQEKRQNDIAKLAELERELGVDIGDMSSTDVPTDEENIEQLQIEVARDVRKETAARKQRYEKLLRG